MLDLYVDDNPLESVQGIPSLTGKVDAKKGKQLLFLNCMFFSFFLALAEPETKKSEPEPQGKVAGLFKAIENNLSTELVGKTQAVYQFNVTGEEAGKW